MLRSSMLWGMLCGALLATPALAEPVLKMVPIDVEGGGGTLFVTPEGRSLLIDTGNPSGTGVKEDALGGAKNSADRIVAAAKALGVKKIDYLLITHYHGDHVGGVVDLLARMPVGTFIDHGDNREVAAKNTAAGYATYLEAIKGHTRMIVKPGDVIRIGSLTDTIVTADGKGIDKPLAQGGENTPACDAPPMSADGGSENGMSVGSILSFGTVRIAALGDLLWNKEHELFCPIDKVGHVNVLIVTHHGTALSSNPAEIAALRPDIAVMGNSATKGAAPGAVAAVSGGAGLQGFWKLHTSTTNPSMDGDPQYIANLEPYPDHGHTIHLDIAASGSITVTNDRNGFSKTYQVK